MAALLRVTRSASSTVGVVRMLSSAASKEYAVGAFELHKLAEGPASTITIPDDEAKSMLRKMISIRRMETAANEEYRKKNIRGFLHLYVGQESCAVGMKSALTDNDSVMTAYRCHGWAHLMGVSMVGVIAELFGRFNGCSQGKGGSMHMYAPKFYGGSGIVGGQVPIGAGLAFAHKYNEDKSVNVTLYGDGAANQGQVFEAFNMAKLWDLPAIFVCENNKYAMGTSQARGAASTNYYTRGDYVPGIKVQAQNVVDVHAATKFARQYVLEHGPIVLELETYRYYGHSMSDPDTTYRAKTEIAEYREHKDPITRFTNVLIGNGVVTEEEVKAMEKECKAEAIAAVAAAIAGPFPAQDEIAKHILINDRVSARGSDAFTRFEQPGEGPLIKY